MARPIPLELPARDPREELRKRLEQAPVKHAEALLDSYALLQCFRGRSTAVSRKPRSEPAGALGVYSQS